MYPHVYKRKKRRPLRNTAITVGVMLLLITVSGAVYVYFSGKHPYVKPEASNKGGDSYKEIKARPPNPKAPASAAIDSLLTPISAGSNTSVSVRTVPTSKCTISVKYKSAASKDSGLGPKVADDYGGVEWTWTVEKSVPAGKYPVTVTCFYGKKSAVVIGDLVVTK